MCLLTVYSAFSWLPTMLNSEGLDVALASSGLTAYNLGGVFGALSCAVAITRIGSRWPLLSAFAGAAVITAGGASAYLVMPGSAMILVLISLSVVCRHLPPLARDRIAGAPR